jgi:small-conductance mechanosensitive channel
MVSFFDYFLTVLLPAIIAVVIGIIIWRIIESRISKFGKEKDIPQSSIHLMRLIVRYILILVIIIAVAGIFGISLGNLWISISTIVLGSLIALFASWSLISNILATMIIMIWRPIEIGNKVTILPENISGELIDINMFFSKLKTQEGDTIQIPNVSFVTKFIKISVGNS